MNEDNPFEIINKNKKTSGEKRERERGREKSAVQSKWEPQGHGNKGKTRSSTHKKESVKLYEVVVLSDTGAFFAKGLTDGIVRNNVLLIKIEGIHTERIYDYFRVFKAEHSRYLYKIFHPITIEGLKYKGQDTESIVARQALIERVESLCKLLVPHMGFAPK